MVARQNSLLLDTVVFSYFLKTSDSRAAEYLPDLQGKLLSISFVTVGELLRWPIERNWGVARTQQLEERIRKVLILPWHESVARQWARIMADNPSRKHNDAWIAACAMTYGLTLVTHDNRFRSIRGLDIICHS